MYFSEPQATPFDVNFSVLGVPVRVSPWFWLATAILGYSLTKQDPRLLFIWAVAVFVSILVHEMGHALVMRHYGEYPRVVLYLMGGLAIGGGSRSSIEQVVISAAGPVIQLLLAALCIVLVRLSGHDYPENVPFWDNCLVRYYRPRPRTTALPESEMFPGFMLWINVWWALINLLPVYPLDGGQISRSLLNLWRPRDGIRLSLSALDRRWRFGRAVWRLERSILYGHAFCFVGFR